MGTNQRSQIEMTAEEISAYLATRRTATLVSLGPTGHPHAVAMWFAVLDGVLWFETKAKAQKALNIRRDPRVTVLMEDGLTYDTLRGVSMEGRAEVVEDPEALWAVGVNVWERYHGPYTDEARPLVEVMLHKRVAVRVDVERTRSWDHRKLGMSPMPLGGTTAAHHPQPSLP
ncbi:PPOX class F420-dependent oxidoreductase [Frankia sp. CNm7]|uniref:PPOX class F420-dependent oxidoreductase n=1 Tax=Frankia nepalensis TaxID=1836974 RepID=A0A937RMY0_9ACTN|nr:PPOX class F420-dependent oxidoreductase [Frankia nepalensis]MBL7502563.1 PPOX class F420-dependent oxidoreductase [Frankia nepalensis]MBL7515146.1 PPOX class F420-dependent oxidoreductase [Frankia nepalensis]MBL7521280.1 PPOX class F420-dependent oxidoreductase [Frankia nepalensis]MBL7633155.1 PPOX class F420-dependent oxidoreductase [Frankia nepalensis]